ncbi:hypothetical protein IKF94_02415 [Candidatus Saccharibacteria bacterium]|nr:hypothetical protein [Candidatus Saccharibacteria bacterium]
MNKDVVYIEPEDDITDIIARVKNAKQKLVALVPPKKIGVLRSAVNTKLIAKAARSSGKVVVIVTTDSSLVKLAATAQIPVAKNLQSRPKLPSEIISAEKTNGEQFINEKDYDDEIDPEEALNPPKSATPVKNQHSNVQSANAKTIDQEITSDDIEKDEEKGSKSDKNGKKDKKGVIPTLEKYRKWIIIGAAAFVVLVGFLVWAFVFAPAADIAVSIRTTANNFSENVSFITKPGSENATSGVFLLEQKKVEKTSSVEFTATGQKDIGEKATGTIMVGAYLNADTEGVPLRIVDGVKFTYGNLSYTVTAGASVSYPESDASCENASTGRVSRDGCLQTAKVTVQADQSGTDSNIGTHDSGWNTNADLGMTKSVSIYNSAAFTGGTSNIVTVVSDTDFNNAKEKLENVGREDGKAELVKAFGDDMIVIEASLEVSTSDPKSTPAVGEEVKSGVTPKIEATTTYTMFAVDMTKVEEFIKEKTTSSVASDQRIYAINKPFFENFTKQNDSTYTAKLKSATQTGPKVTEEDILEKSKGKKNGEVTSILKSINGVSSVKITPSFPWVNSVPNDPNKITIELKVEE